jgi:hypothetical protein
MKQLLQTAITWILISLQLICGQDTTQLVYLDQGQLVYEPFAMTGQTNLENVIPDFSYAGYMGGGVALPTDMPVQVTVAPEPGDDTQRIQAAIDLVEALPVDERGFRGVVLLKAGHYSIETLLLIQASGVVLRGEGQGLNGTVLHANRRVEHNVITILGGDDISLDAQTQQAITTPYLAVGSSSFQVADASAYAVGDQIVIRRTPNEAWINELGMDQETLCQGKSGCNGWTTSGYTLDHERTITAIAGETISVDIPVVDVIEEQYGGGEILKVQSTRRINRCGVENLRVQSFYTRNTDEDHAWTAIRLRDAENCWVREVTGQYLAYSTVNIDDANYITVQDCAYIEPKSQVSGGRRYSFAIQKGIGNLIQRCYTKSGRHDFVTGSRVTGPNVFLDGLAEDARSDVGPHHRWATGTLFDNIRCGSTRVWNRGNSGSGHGWSGAQTMFWNIDSYAGEFRVDSPLGGMNWGVGCTGGTPNGEGYYDSWGSHVQPRSLYLQQLEDRLGSDAVDNVVIAQQKNGQIYDVLADWAGQGDFAQGGYSGAAPDVAFADPSESIDVSTWQPSDIEVMATDPDGTVRSVRLLINGEPLATDDQAPFVFSDLATTIQQLSHTVHYLQAIATDNDGYTSSTRIPIMGGEPPLIEEEEEEQANLEIRAYPSPTYAQDLVIELIDDSLYTAEVYDLSGRLVDAFTIVGTEHRGIQQNLPGGVYILRIKRGEETLTRIKLLLK